MNIGKKLISDTIYMYIHIYIYIYFPAPDINESHVYTTPGGVFVLADQVQNASQCTVT